MGDSHVAAVCLGGGAHSPQEHRPASPSSSRRQPPCTHTLLAPGWLGPQIPRLRAFLGPSYLRWRGSDSPQKPLPTPPGRSSLPPGLGHLSNVSCWILKLTPILPLLQYLTPFVWINFLWKLFFPLEKNFEKLTGQDDVPPCLQLGDLQHPMTLHLCLPLEGLSPLQERSQRLPQPGQPPQRGGGWGPLPGNAAINNSPSRCLGIPKGLS